MSCRKVLYEDSDGGKLETIDVYLRVKPSKCEDQAAVWKISDDKYVSITCPASSRALKRKLGKHEENRFLFTHIFGPEVQQQQLFEKCIEAPLIDFIGGHNTLVFSYGTSNCGKTYTIQGTRHHPGIIPRVLHLVFNTLGEHLMPSEDLKYMPYMNGVIDICDQSRRQLHEHKRTLTEQPIDEIDLMGTDIPEIERAFNQMEEQLDGEMRQVHAVPCNRKCSLWISYIEIYNEALFDLLRPLHPPRKQLKLAEDSSKAYYVKDLSYVHVATAAEAYKVLMFGKKNLQTATTHQNKRSSRSHCIFTLCLLQTADDGQMSVSRLSICDLAGVERQKNTHNMGDRLKESQHINCSLHVLRRCFDRMRDNQSRADKLVVPYRESKLTKLFQKSLSGDGKVIMLVNVNPETNFEELLNVMKASAIARKVIISDTTINTPSSMRKHRRSVLFTASLAEHNNTHSLVENCDVLEEETEPTFLNAAGDDDETPMKKSKIMIPSTSSASRVHPKHTITSDNKNSTETLLRKEVHTLKATIERLKEQNKSMSAEVTELKAIKMKGMDVEKHNQQVDDLLDEMDEMRKTMQKKIDDKVSVLREAFTEIQYYEKDITELSRRNEKLERDLLVKETKLDELNKQISVNDTVLAAKTDKNEELEAMVDGLQEDVEQLMMMVETKDTQLKEAHDSMRADKIAFDKKCADLEKLSTELDALKSLYSEKLQENIQLKGDLRKEKEREFKLEKDNKDKVDQAESFEREISTYNARCKGLTEKVEQLEKKLVNSEILFKTIIESKDQEVKVLEKRILDNENVYKITIGAKDREIKELEKKIIGNENLYKITIGSKDKEIEELEKKILENENLHKLTIESKNREIKDLGSLLQGKKSTNEELKSGSEELQRRYAALLKKLDEELRAKDEQIAEMKRNLDMCMLEKDLLEKECEHSRVYTRELEMKKSTQFWTNVEDLEELRKEKKALETSYEELEKSLEEESSHTSILLSQIENEKARTGEMQVSLVNMRRRNARLKRLLDKTREETNARELYLERQLEKKREELREEKDKVESFKNANEELKMGLIKCEEKFIEYEKKIETLLDNNEKSSSTTSSLTYYKNEIKHLKYELSKCEEKFLKAQKTLENTVDKFQLTEKLLKKNLEEKEQEISTFKQYHIGEVETLNNEIKKLKRSLVEEKVMIEAHSLKEKTDETIKKHLAEYQKEIVQFSKDTDKFEEKVLLIENLKQSIDKKEAELKEATACLSQHQQENNNLKNEIAQLKEKFDQYVGVMEEDITRDSKIKDLTERVNQYRNEIYDLKSQQMNIECHNCGLAIKHLNK